MTFLTVMQFIVNIIVVGFLLTVIVIGLIWLIKDKRQSQHSVLRNYPLLARIRYISEKWDRNYVSIYFLDNVNLFHVMIIKNIVLAGKYNSRMTSFGTTKDYQDGFYIQNTMFPMQRNEISVNIIQHCYQHSFIKSRMSVYLVVKNIVYRQDLIRIT
ncbi:hypothetical protein ACVPOS_04720 [Staphylococcus aureus]